MDEKQLVRQAADGDTKAFEQLVVQYQKPVYNLMMRMVGNADDALDLSQEAFLRVWRSLKQFKFESSFSTWLYKLSSNVCIDFLRQKKRAKTVVVELPDDASEQMEQPDPTPGPEESVMRADERERICAAMDELEPEYREALTLCAIHGLSYIEIAEVMDVPVGTVKSRVARAREKMRRKLLSGGNKLDSRSSTKTGREASAK